MKAKNYYNYNMAVSSYEDTEDGGLLIRNVPVMAAGDWTSMQGIRTIFTADMLERCAGQWDEYGIWSRHPGGSPRNVNEKIGIVRAPHYSPQDKAVMADLYLHQRTELSRDVAKLVRTPTECGGIRSVSIESYLETDGRGIVTDAHWTGVAVVDQGACLICKMPAYGKAGSDNMAEENKTEDGNPTFLRERACLEAILPAVKEAGNADIASVIEEVLGATDDETAKAAMAKFAEGANKPPVDESPDFEKRIKGIETDFGKKLNALETALATEQRNSASVLAEFERWKAEAKNNPQSKGGQELPDKIDEDTRTISTRGEFSLGAVHRG